VASEEFQVGAAVQAKALGLEPAIVWVPHPIQNRRPEELAAIADAAVGPILERIGDAPAARRGGAGSPPA